jgi:hypothetical protein
MAGFQQPEDNIMDDMKALTNIGKARVYRYYKELYQRFKYFPHFSCPFADGHNEGTVKSNYDECFEETRPCNSCPYQIGCDWHTIIRKAINTIREAVRYILQEFKNNYPKLTQRIDKDDP